MATKTATEIKTDLDDLLYEDTPDVEPYSLARKRRAINRALRSSWPHFKIAKENKTAVTLAAQTYQYALTVITDLEDVANGVAVVQALLEPPRADQDWIQLRQCVQSRNSAVWTLHVPPRVVDGNPGRKLALRYYAKPAEFTWTGTETLPAEFANYVIYAACVDLFQYFAQAGSQYDVDDVVKLIPVYSQRAADELKKNIVYTMPMLVGARSEGYQ